MFIEIILEVLGDLQRLNGRSSLALFGVAIGTAAVIAVFHVGYSARTAALKQFHGVRTDVMMITPEPMGKNLMFLRADEVLDLPKQIDGVKVTAAIIQTNASIHVGKIRINAILLAATDAIYSVGNAELMTGRLTSDLDGSAPFVVLGANVAAEVTAGRGYSILIGETIVLDKQVMIVIGVLEDTPASVILALEFNRSIFIPFHTYERIRHAPAITNIAARLSPDANDVRTTEAIIRHFDSLSKSVSVLVRTARQILVDIEKQMQIYSSFLLGVGSISLIVSGAGIMNVMLSNVMRRREEIGLRLALGARRRDVVLMFLTESVMLSALGCVFGTGTGYCAAWIFVWQAGWDFDPAPLALPLGAGLASGVGLLFGVYPAFRAARLDPIAALQGQ